VKLDRSSVALAVLSLLIPAAASAQHSVARKDSAFTMMIKQMDKDRDGKVSREEYFAAFPDRKAAEQNFKKWDYDKDGFLTSADYKLQPARKPAPPKPPADPNLSKTPKQPGL
jgi:hypothetical protein